jgi:hypothetical protein
MRTHKELRKGTFLQSDFQKAKEGSVRCGVNRSGDILKVRDYKMKGNLGGGRRLEEPAEQDNNNNNNATLPIRQQRANSYNYTIHKAVRTVT